MFKFSPLYLHKFYVFTFLNISSTSTLSTFHLHKFYSFTFLNLSSASTLTLPTWFSYKFLLLHFHLSPLFHPSYSLQKRSILSLSLSLQFCLFWCFFYLFIASTTFSPIMVLFVIVDLFVTSHLFLFLANLYQLLCIFRYSNSR